MAMQIINGNNRIDTIKGKRPVSDRGVQTIVAGSNITVDNTDPANPIVSSVIGGTMIDESFVPTNGQTEFVLSNVPSNNSRIYMFVNNATYIVGQNFLISGATITWLEDFSISTDDIIVIRYPT